LPPTFPNFEAGDILPKDLNDMFTILQNICEGYAVIPDAIARTISSIKEQLHRIFRRIHATASAKNESERKSWAQTLNVYAVKKLLKVAQSMRTLRILRAPGIVECIRQLRTCSRLSIKPIQS